MTFISATNKLLRHAQARVLLVGSGRMGHIRAKAIYSNPRFEFCGIVDSNVEEAAKLGEIYRVRAESIVRPPPCSDKSLSLHFPTSQNHDTMYANTY
mmetsp:Transcript_44165/g.79234  ORF Transcript_44165/g.79234 Transcript_44165/m.79234 type:complete len:97 (-) Transcript_44165:1206-1496(-)